MNHRSRGRRRAAILIGLAASAVASAVAQASTELSLLGRLERGLWQLRDLDGGRSPSSPVCIGDPAVLTQLRHRNDSCSRTIVAAGQDSVAVRYSCPASGFGHTTIRVETPRLARIESQGVADGAPFGFRAEARRVGDCR